MSKIKMHIEFELDGSVTQEIQCVSEDPPAKAPHSEAYDVGFSDGYAKAQKEAEQNANLLAHDAADFAKELTVTKSELHLAQQTIDNLQKRLAELDPSVCGDRPAVFTMEDIRKAWLETGGGPNNWERFERKLTK